MYMAESDGIKRILCGNGKEFIITLKNFILLLSPSEDNYDKRSLMTINMALTTNMNKLRNIL